MYVYVCVYQEFRKLP